MEYIRATVPAAFFFGRDGGGDRERREREKDGRAMGTTETAQDSATLARLFLARRRPSLLRNGAKSAIARVARSNHHKLIITRRYTVFSQT